MQLRYGNYTHAIGDPSISIKVEPLSDDGGNCYAHRLRWDVAGMLTAPNAAACNAKAANLIDAYSVDGLDLTLLLPDGTPTVHQIRANDTLGGVRVVQPPQFTEGGACEGATIRHYTLAVEAVRLVVPGNVLLSFGETVTYSGGGPQVGHRETLTGLPMKQLLRRASVFHATQAGEAVGLLAYPAIPSPLWPSALVRKPEITQHPAAKWVGGARLNFKISWRYEFESALPLVGGPHVR